MDADRVFWPNDINRPHEHQRRRLILVRRFASRVPALRRTHLRRLIDSGLCARCRLGPIEFPTEQPAGDADRTRAQSIGAMTRIFLPDTDNGATEAALVDPGSSEMPPARDRSVRVQLLGEIARGGMGVVLKGRDPDLGRDIAVKLLLESHKENADLVRRFVEEAQIAGQLQHPGVVPVYELGTFGDLRPYFTMKLVKGRTLAELLGGARSRD